MLIKCPKCQTMYEVKDNLIGSKGLKMHCNQCNEVFRAYPEDAVELPAPKEKDVSFAQIFKPFTKNTGDIFQNKDNPKVRVIRLTHYKNKVNYILLLTLLALFLAILYLLRYDIVRIAPGTESLYQRFGVQSVKNGFMLDFENITTEEYAEENLSKIKVSGIISNNSKYPMYVLPIKLIVYNREGKKLLDMTHFLPQKRMNPGYKIPFKIVFINPSEEQKNIHITFTDKI